MIVRDRETAFDEGGAVNIDVLHNCVKEHAGAIERYVKLDNYYNLDQAILERKRSVLSTINNRIPHDLPRYITTIAAGYLIGEPVTYETSDEAQGTALDTIIDAYTAYDAPSVDSELAVLASKFGKAVEICYLDEEAQPCSGALSPMEAFVVYDNTVKHRPLFGVHILPKLDREGNRAGTDVDVYTDAMVYNYTGGGGADSVQLNQANAPATHAFDSVPVVEYWNNESERGDYEGVLALIDAYNSIESDRINDKQQFTDAILVGYNFSGFDPTQEELEAQDEDPNKKPLSDAERLKKTPIAYIPNDARLEWLVKQINEQNNEILRKAIESDIHKYSMVPNLTDESFASNASGVAMKYKLFGLNELTKTKERWFKEALRNRLRLFASALHLLKSVSLDVAKVRIQFTRGLPVNELETAQVVSTYASTNVVPRRLLAGQVPFIDDPDAAIKELDEEAAAEAKRQADAFGMPSPDMSSRKGENDGDTDENKEPQDKRVTGNGNE